MVVQKAVERVVQKAADLDDPMVDRLVALMVG